MPDSLPHLRGLDFRKAIAVSEKQVSMLASNISPPLTMERIVALFNAGLSFKPGLNLILSQAGTSLDKGPQHLREMMGSTGGLGCLKKLALSKSSYTENFPTREMFKGACYLPVWRGCAKLED